MKKKFRVTPYCLILPVIIASCVFSFYPLIKTVISSLFFTNEYGEWTGWAGSLYRWRRLLDQILSDPLSSTGAM